MNSYYVMIHFDGSYVDGYFVPQATDEKNAFLQLKRLLVAQIILTRRRLSNIQEQDYHSTDVQLKRLKSHYTSLKRPWRFTKEKFAHRSSPVCRIMKWDLPFEATYWLRMVGTNTHLCNLQDK